MLLSPIAPSRLGPGLSMRADQLVRALAPHARVHLRVIPIQERNPRLPRTSYDGPVASHETVWETPSLLHRLRHHGDYERARLSSALTERCAESVAMLEADAIVAFRHLLAPLGFVLRTRHPRAQLIVDLDELESHTRQRLAELHARRGEARAARSMRAQAESYRAREQVELVSANQLWTCSPKEGEWVAAATGLATRVVPNVVDRVSDDILQRSAGPTHRILLFVGGLGYVPNLDAVEWLAGEILPQLQQIQPTTLRVIGSTSPAVRRRLGRVPGLELAGRVDSLTAEYAQAAVVVVPVRAGGGTRIKLLEALAHGRPVVSTSMGAEGLDLSNGRDLALADDAPSFASECEQLFQDRSRAEAMGASGQRIVRERYSPEELARIVGRALDDRQRSTLADESPTP